MTFDETLRTLAHLHSLVEGGGDDSVFSAQQKGWISKLHKSEFGEPVRECGCKNKYTDAVILLYAELCRKGQTSEESKYVLRRGTIIWIGTDCYSYHNITDAVAQQYLAAHPDETYKFEIKK